MLNELFSIIVTVVLIGFGFQNISDTSSPTFMDYLVNGGTIVFGFAVLFIIFASLYYRPILASRKTVLLDYHRRIEEAERSGNVREKEILEMACDLYIETFRNKPMFVEDEDVDELVEVRNYG